MVLNKLLEDNAAWLDKAAKQRVFDKIDDKVLTLSGDLRQRLIVDCQARIAALSQRKEDAVASYDRAIGLEKAKLDSLMAEKPLQPPRMMKAKAASKKPKKKR